ncbi:MAG: CRISPR-associated helicase Cas3' [Clostridia bacterium]|nr:CRISPR-associated helicase Cas3' [Clostridia bacterium]
MKLAHRLEKSDGSVKNQGIQEHCQNVASLAAGFANVFKAASIAHYVGLLHDIGKYSDAFQRRILGSKERVDHSTAGAQVAWRTNTIAGRISAFCISGHHGGLPDFGSKYSDASEGTLQGKLKRSVEPYGDYENELPVSEPVLPDWAGEDCRFNPYYLTKMLFSALVDADYLDTEAFMSNGTISRNIGENIPTLADKMDRFTEPWKQSTTELNAKRSQILECVIRHAEEEKGLFSLTVPTGGGKTTASMAFALHHARRHSMSRIIYVIPYTSIIEQTQAVFESIFGKDNVVAHYSGVEYSHKEGAPEDRRYLATENWDAPIILTTSVQFFESIYGNRPSKCRKLHNIANSVIIFDEAQMLPVPFLRPCVLAIAKLVRYMNCSAVLCTATQPALNRIFAEFLPDTRITELCPDELFSDPIFARVVFRTIGKLSDNDLADRLATVPQVLCIVNSRKSAQEIYGRLPKEGSFHLSTTMTPEHRQRTLNIVRERLQNGHPCRVISTSLIEAGVDIDFPVVYRELAGLDSILQAAGRCNREGKRSKEDSPVYIFTTDHKIPEMLEQNCSAAQRVMDRDRNLASKASIHAYFAFLLYTLKDQKALDRQDILSKMPQLSFETIAKEFKMISGADYVLYISCPESEPLLRQYKQFGPSKPLLRALGRFAVNVYERQFRDYTEQGATEPISENAAILTNSALYDPEVGLVLTYAAQADQYII